MSRIDYSKWDKLNYSSSSSEEEDDEKEKTQKARAAIAHLGSAFFFSGNELVVVTSLERVGVAS